MSTLTIATSEADAAAVAAIEQHHTELAGTLRLHAERVVQAAATGNGDGAAAARPELLGWRRAELFPHAEAEEETLYPAAVALPQGRLLIEGMIDEHARLAALAGEMQDAPDDVRAAAAARALLALFESHVAKENELILPLLAASGDVSLADLLTRMHDELSRPGDATSPGEAQSGCGGHCACGERDEERPQLDVREVPHAIRHATVMGALDAIRPGGALELVAPHDPLPLLAQIERRWQGGFEVEYAERGPSAWRLVLTRSTSGR
jgi:uncharacterized protein (DUF2249 family)